MLFVTPPLYVLVTDLMLSQWKGLWCSWALYSSSTLIAVYFYSTYYIQSATGCSNVLCIAGDCRCDDVCFVPLSLPDWCPAFQPFHGHPFLYISSFPQYQPPTSHHHPKCSSLGEEAKSSAYVIALCETRDWWHCMKSPMAIGPEASNYLKPHDLSNGRIVQSIVSAPPLLSWALLTSLW